jgi:Mrp family chromosome partitioning ATPase
LSEGLEYGRCAGLSELLAGKIEITTSFQPMAAKVLSFLPVGQAPRPAGSRAADALEAAIRKWKIDFDCLLIDAGNADGDLASALAEAADATYLVVELGAVEANAAQVALARLRAAGARVLGCIAT